MLFSIILSLLASTAFAATIPALPRSYRVFPRQNASGGLTDGTPVAGAGGTLNLEAAAAANQRDDTATRAFSGVPITAADGQCLFINATAGDFREELIPVQTKACDGTTNEKFDIITAGKHIDQPGGMIVVSTEVRREL